MEQRSAPARPLWDRIQAVCAERGWNTVRLERETGIPRQTINKWKTAPRSPQAATVNPVARVLDIKLEEALRLAGILPSEEEPERTATVEELAERTRELERELERRTRELKERDREREARSLRLEAAVAAVREQLREVLGDEAADRVQRSLDDGRDNGDDERRSEAG